MSTSNLALFFQEPSGAFSSSLLSLAPDHGPGPVVAADFDDDGLPDLASSTSLFELRVVFQSAARDFDRDSLIVLPGFNATDLEVFDLFGDGFLDIVLANPGAVLVFDQVGPHQFLPSRVMGFLPSSARSALAVADCDRDGDLDLVAASSDQPSLNLFLQTIPVSTRALPVGDPSTISSPADVVAVDIDGDGEADLACANSSGGTLAVFWNGR